MQPLQAEPCERLFREACRTVASVSSQFEELQRSVLAVKGLQGVLQRGYFTPSDDEWTQRLLVTYWQMRTALLELVNEIRARGARSSDEYASLFLPGYAGALVLLDAAMFLREQFHDQPLIRAKLNEAEPNFGIPAGVYELIQRSWTRPRHAWELFDAARYFQNKKELWQTLRRDGDAAAMLDLIEKLSKKHHAQWTDYAKARVRCWFRTLRGILERDLLGTALFQMQKAIGTLAAERYLKLGHQPGLPREIRHQLNALLSPGDILLVRKEYALTNYFLPGYWPHTALYLGNVPRLTEAGLDRNPSIAPRWSRFVDCSAPDEGRVIEAMKDGVHIRSMDSPYRSDSILVLRPNLSEEEIHLAIARALHHEGKEYDFSFDFTVSSRLVCTEVIYRAYDGVNDISFPLSMRAGRMTLAAAELVAMALENKHFRIAATYIPAISSEIEQDDQAIHLVRKVVPPTNGNA